MKQFNEQLRQLEQKSAKRELRFSPIGTGTSISIQGKTLLNFSSNDYLGLSNNKAMCDASAKSLAMHGCGSTASRLIVGNIEPYKRLEERLAESYAKEAALVFPTGYMANVGLISALTDSNDIIFCDKLNHASIMDGIFLSKAEFKRYPHNDLFKLEDLLKNSSPDKNKFIIVDAIFSMDGDRVKLKEIAALACKYDAFLVVDEAHANGTLGQNGLGLAEEVGVLDKIDLIMGTFSKALGSLGGYVVGSQDVIDFLINRARSFIYTTGLPASVLAANLVALDIVRDEPERRIRLAENAKYLREGLQDAGFDTLNSSTHIIPVLMESNQAALDMADKLYEAGFLALAIRPPTVPPGTARLRVSLSSQHTKQEIDSFLKTIINLKG